VDDDEDTTRITYAHNTRVVRQDTTPAALELTRTATDQLMDELNRVEKSTTRSIDQLNQAELDIEEVEREFQQLEEKQSQVDKILTQHGTEPDTNDDHRSQTSNRSNDSKRSSPRSPSRNSNMVEDDDSFGLPSDFRFDEYIAEPLSPRSARSNRSSPKSTSTRDSLLDMGFKLQEIESAERAVSNDVSAMVAHILKSQEKASEHSTQQNGSL